MSVQSQLSYGKKNEGELNDTSYNNPPHQTYFRLWVSWGRFMKHLLHNIGVPLSTWLTPLTIDSWNVVSDGYSSTFPSNVKALPKKRPFRNKLTIWDLGAFTAVFGFCLFHLWLISFPGVNRESVRERVQDGKGEAEKRSQLKFSSYAWILPLSMTSAPTLSGTVCSNQGSALFLCERGSCYCLLQECFLI